MIARLLQQQVPVKLRVNVQSTFYDADGGNTYNVLAELPGTDPALRDEVVMIGAHLDSWHTGVGATDNADGSTTVMEAMRILTAVGARPRRTIRVALWSGEEQGLLGLAGLGRPAPRRRGQRRRAREVLRLLQHRPRQWTDLRLVSSRTRDGSPADLRRLARAAQGRSARASNVIEPDRQSTDHLSFIDGSASPASIRSRTTSTTTSAPTTPTWTPPSA